MAYSDSAKDVIQYCIDRLGSAKPSMEEFDTVIIPIRDVRETLKNLKRGLWEPGDPIENAPPELREKLKKVEMAEKTDEEQPKLE